MWRAVKMIQSISKEGTWQYGGTVELADQFKLQALTHLFESPIRLNGNKVLFQVVQLIEGFFPCYATQYEISFYKTLAPKQEKTLFHLHQGPGPQTGRLQCTQISHVTGIVYLHTKEHACALGPVQIDRQIGLCAQRLQKCDKYVLGKSLSQKNVGVFSNLDHVPRHFQKTSEKIIYFLNN